MTNGTIGLITTTSLAPASIAMSRFVVDTMPAVDQLAVAARAPARRPSAAPRRRARRSRSARRSSPSTPNTTRSQRVEVGGRQVQLAVELAEVVGAAGLAEHLVQVALDPRARVERPTAGPSASPRTTSISETPPRWAISWRASDGRAQRQQRALARELQQVRAQQIADVDVFERRLALARDDAHHLLGRDAVGAQRGDERAGRGADVDVEVVDRAVDRQQVERPQRADLVHAAGEAAAAEHERGLVAPGTAPAVDRCRPARRRGRRNRACAAVAWPSPVGSSLTTLPMRRTFYGCVRPEPAVQSSSILLCGLSAGRRAGARRSQRRAAIWPGCRPTSAHQLALAGPADGAYVYDLTTKQALFSERAGDDAPAGLGREALHRHDGARADGRRRRAWRRPSTASGSWRPAASGKATCTCAAAATRRSAASAFIRRHYDGVGASVSALVAQLVQTDGIHRVTGSVDGDESYFDSLRGEPSSDYALRPVPRRHAQRAGLQPRRNGLRTRPARPAAYAARELWDALKATASPSTAAAAPPPRPRAPRRSRRCSRRRSRSCSA